MSAILKLEKVNKWAVSGQNRTEILRDITMTVEPGEFIAIIGPSGSGKSTLLNLLGLLDVPSSGTLRLLNQDVSTLEENQLALLRARSIGFIFQTFNLLPYLNASQNIELSMSYTGHPNPRQHSQKLLTQMHLQHRAAAYPATLSGGERQRVAIARALANDPALLLADEPTGALDSRTGAQILELIRGLHARGSTIVLVTHDESIARQAQRVLVMKDGRFE